MGFFKTLNAQQRLQKAIVDIMGKPQYTALCGVLMIGTRTVVNEGSPEAEKLSKTLKRPFDTACTNGKDEWYCEEFVDTLTDAELRFLILHECYHKMYRHLTTWQHLYKADAHRTDLATDFVINLKIMEDNPDNFVKIPVDKASGQMMAAYDKKFAGMDTAQVYRLLPDMKQPQGGEGQQGGGEGQSGGKPQPGKGKGKPKPGEGSGSGNQQLDGHMWEDAQEMSEEDKKELEREIDAAIRQGAIIASQQGTGGNRSLEDLLEAKVDWKAVLREFVSTVCSGNDFSTWRRPNRRFVGAGFYMPSGITERVGELVIAIDTSGSIGGDILRRFLGEVKCICETVNPEGIRLLYWDTQVCGDELYGPKAGNSVDDLVKSTKPKGGGGTMVECVPAYIQKEGIEAAAVIVFTDGYLGGSWGQWVHPVMWCILDNKSAQPSVGQHVHIQSDDID